MGFLLMLIVVPLVLVIVMTLCLGEQKDKKRAIVFAVIAIIVASRIIPFLYRILFQHVQP